MSGQATQSIAISAVTALTSVGPDAEQSAGAISAGIVQISEHATYECVPDDPEWDEYLPCYVSTVPAVKYYVDEAERFYQLAMPALQQVMSLARLKRENLGSCGFFLSLPPNDTAIANLGVDQQFLIELSRQAGLLNLKAGKISQSGSSGMFELIGEAMELLQTRQLDFCIVGGVDSWLLDERLEQLDIDMRLKSGRNRDGFVPGEAATMVMLERLDTARSRGATILSIVSGYGRGEEPDNFSSQKNSSGQGLTQAVEGVLSSQQDKVFHTVYCDLNGESYYAIENGVVLGRLGRSLEAVELIHPATNCGDVGAATGGLLIACAAMSHYQDNGSSDDVLLWAASDNGIRAALSLQQGDTKKNP